MKKIGMLIMMMALMVALSACSKESTKTATTAAETTSVSEEKMVITIGNDDAYPPFEYRDENGELVGFDIDFIDAMAEEMGADIVTIPTTWDGIFVGLETNKYDCIISAVSITNERLENYTFSKPYLSNGQVIVVRTQDEGIESVEALEGKIVGVQLETTADKAAEKQKELTNFELVKYDDILQTFAELDTGRIDCIVVDYAVAIDYAKKSDGKYTITTTQLTNEPIGVCMKKGNDELKEKFDTALKTLQENGKMKELSQKWFEGDYVSDIDEELK